MLLAIASLQLFTFWFIRLRRTLVTSLKPELRALSLVSSTMFTYAIVHADTSRGDG